MSDLLLVDVADGVAMLTLNRPEARNALSSELLAALPAAMADCEADDAIEVVVLTGADPAFCAGLDLRELGSTGSNFKGGGEAGDRGFWAPMTKPVIGAVNGPAVTGGFEVALQCDFLIASERARFGDTHARVGVIPGGGLSVLLPQAIGMRRAREMSLTGNFMTADEALQWGLVNHVVAHDELLQFTLSIAADIRATDREARTALLAGYLQTSLTTVDEAWRFEAAAFRDWGRRHFDPAAVEARRQAIVERGRTQT